MIVSDDVYRVKQGATGPPLSGTLPVTILGANVVMKMVNVLNLNGPVLGGACVNLDTGTTSSKGRFRYDWQSADTATPGIYRVEFHVTFAPSTPDETVEIFPEDDYEHVEVVRAISGAFSPSTPGGGGLTPTTLALGPYTIEGVTGTDAARTEAVDLGENAIGAIRYYAIALTAIDFDGGDPAGGFTVDFITSFDGVVWETEADPLVDRPNVYGGQPAGFTSETVPRVVRGNLHVTRFIRFICFWAGDQGPAASATFHVDLIYF